MFDFFEKSFENLLDYFENSDQKDIRIQKTRSSRTFQKPWNTRKTYDYKKTISHHDNLRIYLELNL